MRSRITIDFNESNEPVIKIDYLASTDVRDKMVKRFLEGFGDSAWASFQMDNSSATEYANSTAIIKPISKSELEDHYKEIGKELKTF